MEPYVVLVLFVGLVGVIGSTGVALALAYEDRRLEELEDKETSAPFR
jgi:hypothetical protein